MIRLLNVLKKSGRNSLFLLFSVLILILFSFPVACTPGSSDTQDTVSDSSPEADTPTDVIDDTTSTPQPAETVAGNSTTRVILIEYLPQIVMQANVGTVLVINIDIQNTGYVAFNTNPEYFHAYVNNKEFDYDPALSNLRTIDIPNGGKLLGKLAFPIASGASVQTIGYTLGYSGKSLYNVQWIKREY